MDDSGAPRRPRVSRFAAPWVPLFALLTFACSSTSTNTAEERTSGGRLYAQYCAACHGTLGEGDGPVAASFSGAVPNLRDISSRNGGEFPQDDLAGYIDGRRFPFAHGERYMPVWGEVFEGSDSLEAGSGGQNPDRIGRLLDYLRSIQYR